MFYPQSAVSSELPCAWLCVIACSSALKSYLHNTQSRAKPLRVCQTAMIRNIQDNFIWLMWLGVFELCAQHMQCIIRCYGINVYADQQQRWTKECKVLATGLRLTVVHVAHKRTGVYGSKVCYLTKHPGKMMAVADSRRFSVLFFCLFNSPELDIRLN